MFKSKAIAIAGLCCFAVGCQTQEKVNTPAASPVSFGYIDSGCFVTSDARAAKLAAGTALDVFDLESQSLSKADIASVSAANEACGALDVERIKAANPDAGLYSMPNELDFAIAWRAGTIDPEILANLNFTSCTTSEGLRYRVAEKSSGKKLWEGYQPLGYDTQSDCPD